MPARHPSARSVASSIKRRQHTYIKVREAPTNYAQRRALARFWFRKTPTGRNRLQIELRALIEAFESGLRQMAKAATKVGGLIRHPYKPVPGVCTADVDYSQMEIRLR